MNLPEAYVQFIAAEFRTAATWAAPYVGQQEAEMCAEMAFKDTGLRCVYGATTVYGPYRALYARLEEVMHFSSRVTGRCVPGGLWRTIPVPKEQTLHDYARLGGEMYRAVRVAGLTDEDRDHFLRAIYDLRVNPAGELYFPVWVVAPARQREVLERTIQDLSEHKCSPCPICRQAFQIERHHHLRGVRWLADYLPRHREYLHG